jgi:predicted nucleic acid-binding protein
VAAFLDASLIVAAADRSDLNHEAAVSWLERVREPLLVGALSLADADVLLQRGLGAGATIALVESVVAGAVRLVPPTEADLARASALMSAAAEHRPRLADAVLIATAERMGVRRIATFERRPLAVLRAVGGPRIDLEP